MGKGPSVFRVLIESLNIISETQVVYALVCQVECKKQLNDRGGDCI